MKILEERDSQYNGRIVVKKDLFLGTYIQAEGLTQSGGIVESIWKQTIKRIANSVRRIDRILILGLGGGTVAKLLRKKYPKAKIIGVEIDPIMIELGKKYFDLDKYNVDIKIQDVIKKIPKRMHHFVDKDFKTQIYDLVIVDLYNGDKFPKKFENDIFLNKLSKNKLIIFNRLYYDKKKNGALKFEESLKKHFKTVEAYKPLVNIMFFCS